MEKLCKIRDIQRAVNQFENAFEKEYGISLNEGMALCSLTKSEQLSSGELGELLGLTSSNMSKVINTIEAKGFISRLMGTKDKRQMFFSLTHEGRSLLEGIKRDKVEIPDLLLPII